MRIRRLHLVLSVILFVAAGWGLCELTQHRTLADSDEKSKNINQLTVDHIRLISGKSFADVKIEFEKQLGKYDPEKAMADGDDPEKTRKRIEAMAGSSGFMIFNTQDHGRLLRLVGLDRKAIQYVIGNPLLALKATEHDIRASLYVPLRVIIYEDAGGKTSIEYDQPSSLLAQFGNAQVNELGSSLDEKLKRLVAETLH